MWGGALVEPGGKIQVYKASEKEIHNGYDILSFSVGVGTMYR